MSYQNINFQQYGTQKLEQYETDINVTRPKQGITQYRMIWPQGFNDFFIEVKKHFIGKLPLYCLKMFNKECPICNQVELLKKSGFDQQSNDYRAQQTFFIAVIERNVAQPVPVLLEVKKMVFNAILSLIADPDYGANLFVPNKGRDIKIEKSGQGIKGTKYSVTPGGQDCPLHQDTNICQQWEKIASELFNIVQEPDQEKIASVLNLLQVPNTMGNYPQPPTQQPPFVYAPQVTGQPIQNYGSFNQNNQQPVPQQQPPQVQAPVSNAQAALDRLKGKRQ